MSDLTSGRAAPMVEYAGFLFGNAGSNEMDALFSALEKAYSEISGVERTEIVDAVAILINNFAVVNRPEMRGPVVRTLEFLSRRGAHRKGAAALLIALRAL